VGHVPGQQVGQGGTGPWDTVGQRSRYVGARWDWLVGHLVVLDCCGSSAQPGAFEGIDTMIPSLLALILSMLTVVVSVYR
jgi:hypothetical protein